MDEKTLRAILRFELDKAALRNAKAGLRDVETAIEQSGKAAKQAKHKADDLSKSFGQAAKYAARAFAGAAMGVAVSSINQYLQATKETEEASRRWLEATEKINAAQIALGRTLTSATLPLMEQLAGVADSINKQLSKPGSFIREPWEYATLIAGMVSPELGGQVAGMLGKTPADLKRSMSLVAPGVTSAEAATKAAQQFTNAPLYPFAEEYAKRMAAERETEEKRTAIIRAEGEKRAALASDYEKRRLDLISSYTKTELKAEQDYYRRRAQLMNQKNVEAARSEEAHQRNMARMRDDASLQMQDAIARGDAIAAMRIMQQYQTSRRHAEEEYGAEVRQRDEDTGAQLADLEDNFEVERAARRDAYNEQLAELENSHAEELAELRKAKDEELAEIKDSLEKEKLVREQYLADIQNFLARSLSLFQTNVLGANNQNFAIPAGTGFGAQTTSGFSRMLPDTAAGAAQRTNVINVTFNGMGAGDKDWFNRMFDVRMTELLKQVD